MAQLTKEQASEVTEGVSVLRTALWPYFVYALNVAYPEWEWVIATGPAYTSVSCRARTVLPREQANKL